MSAVQLPQLSGSSSSTKARTVTGTAGPFNSSSRSSSQDTRSASPNPSTVPRIADQHKLPPGSPKNSSPRTLVARKDNFSLSANTSPIMSPSPNDRGRTPGRAIISGGLGGDDTRGRSLTPISPARSLRKLDSMDPPTSGSRNTTTASRSPSPAVIPPPSSLSNVPPGTSSGRPKAHAPSPLAQGLRSLEPLKTQDDNLPPFSYTSSPTSHAGNGPLNLGKPTESGFNTVSPLRPHTPLRVKAPAANRRMSMARSASNLFTVVCTDASFPEQEDGEDNIPRMTLSTMDLSLNYRDANTSNDPYVDDAERKLMGLSPHHQTDTKRHSRSVSDSPDKRTATSNLNPKKRQLSTKMNSGLELGKKDATRGTMAKSASQLAPGKSMGGGSRRNMLDTGGDDKSARLSSSRLSTTAKTEKQGSVFLIDSDLQFSAHVKKLWKRVARKLLEVIKGAGMFSSFLNRNAAVVALHIKGTDDVLSKQVREVLGKAKGSRSEEDMQQVDRILTNLCPHLDKIGREKRSRLYDTMTYEFHPKGTILSRVGVTPESVYFVLSGSADVGKSILKPQFKYKSKACGVGSVIGIITDLEMMTEEAKFRREDVVLTSDSDFVRVRVDDYIRAIYSHDGGSVDQKVVLLNSFPFFAHATEDLLMTAVANCDIVHGSPNQVIVEEDEPYDRIYFVCKGSCIASKSVRFIKTSQRPQNNKSRKRSAIIPWVPGVSRQTTDEALDQKLEYVDVVKGETFPVIPLPEALPKPIPSSNAKYVSLMTADTLRPLIVEPTPPISYVTITSSPNTGCTLLSMRLYDFMALASNSMMHLAFTYGVRYRISVPLLQEAFLISVGYKDGGDMMATTDFRTVLKGLVERYKEMNYSPDSVPIEATKMVAEGLEGVEGVEEEVTVVAVEKPPPSPADVRSGPKASHMGLASYKIGSLS